MSKAIEAVLESNHRSKSADDKRAIAVAAALAIIQSKVSNAPTNSAAVEDEMKNLSSYADQIEAALKVK